MSYVLQGCQILIPYLNGLVKIYCLNRQHYFSTAKFFSGFYCLEQFCTKTFLIFLWAANLTCFIKRDIIQNDSQRFCNHLVWSRYAEKYQNSNFKLYTINYWSSKICYCLSLPFHSQNPSPNEHFVHNTYTYFANPKRSSITLTAQRRWSCWINWKFR